MPAPEVYQRISRLLAKHIDSKKVSESCIVRLSLYITGLLRARNGSPAQVAKALESMQLNGAKSESLERQIRRMENDPGISAETCFNSLVRQLLLVGKPQELLLILDPTLQEDRIVMVSVNIWYRGRTLPLCWTTWPANRPLKGARFWERISTLLLQAKQILPQPIRITCVADREFGTPAFTDILEKLGWNWVVRVQDQTLCQDRQGKVSRVRDLVEYPGQRKKMRGYAFKKAGWRVASVVAYWGHRHARPMCLISNLPPSWYLVKIYRQRFPIECSFRDLKSYGWRWEQGQVTNLEHMQRLLVGMALATWIVQMMGSWKAKEILSHPSTGKRHTRAWYGKISLFQIGLSVCDQGFLSKLPLFEWLLTDWTAPNWSAQIYAHHSMAYILAL